MDKPTHLIEFETMLLGRYVGLHPPQYKHGGNHLDRSAYTLLSRIDMQGPMSIGELGEAFGLDTSTLSRQTSAMVNSGLVQRISDPDGGMARKFRITDEGMRRLGADRAGNVDGLDRVVADWEPEDVATFAMWLRRFNSDVEKLAGRPWPRT
ncbi:transcriptional regulator [Rhodococcus sp. AD45-ID]|jgi:DNA-binding MarR family transcriptional regulator|uniref:MarR family winged helix-turn-helix transcriptional regulator n=1 Tax=Rhodococcus TaxID=1827 RepID=UPI0005D3FA6F|nr:MULTISPECIES: MarR family transcriptional regulator [Rhodococcus]KJF20641.1 MarR family protein [Rhodococcus sp. AD45]MCE4264253.1 MarR family transcriptional regulator [Rhodococcus globerulus]PSR38239.1 transcriptional regulator [Rhodococcus sp. AD45-ID]QXW01135.1 MarR family transcriptional regulator [Rhodococcus globerulus]RZL24459.1 MAG: MarR family transcriptional regulator [Rhodococcus sp. (in: high G+C Gram-positive bacteria)]